MLFNSPQFIFIFLPIVFVGYFVFSTFTPLFVSRTWLALCSLFFYGWWNPRYLLLILTSIIINFIIGKLLLTQKKRQFLIIGIIFNLGLLGYYKYFDFFLSNINAVFKTDISLLHVVLPLAISFFTFQQITYIVDCYKGKIENYSFINYVLFVTFFPHLIAGPIVHHSVMMPQFQNVKNQKINFENISLGFFVFSIGLFKKVILADHFSTTVVDGMQYIDSITFFDAWTVMLSYTLQLYFDFSGYSDMAIGLALLFNIKLPINFSSPYKATNFQELISRWHITLTKFLYEYVYYPMNHYLFKKALPTLKIKIGTNAKTNINVILLFILSGIWHGAGWNFIIWGFLFGLGIVVYRFWSRLKFKLPLILAWFVTFAYLNLVLVFFKVAELKQAFKLLGAMLGYNGFILPMQLDAWLHPLTNIGFKFTSTPLRDKYQALGLILIGLIIVLAFKNTSEKMQSFKPKITYTIFVVVLIIISVINLAKISEFLYFKF
ncbi:MBOAT family O-acyltransferase [Paenibacillus whitsoniae]|uniref:MBOAT family protein n=1 Tax=Paenibacillus whitsoniae TaxID=2496558 RepID=A0A3S0BJQ7_9BACL|nr:MBOAT family O-acyltransferase [Paenibacillus whitsoniae]RTE08147.1 MBOAT family protein [Paenibacillus whitsoniae]